MKVNKNFKIFFKKYFYKIRIIIILLGTFIMFHAYYFSDKPATLETIIQNKGDKMMYLCIFFSFGISLLMSYSVGLFNKGNIRKMTTMDGDEE